MLLNETERKKLNRWLQSVPPEGEVVPVVHYLFVGDGTETVDDIRYVLSFADRWYSLNGYHIVDNYDELKQIFDKWAVQRAKELAKEQFAGRTDKAGVDYFEGHLSSVATLAETDEEKATAYLHDILEDTDYPEDRLREDFGDRIVDAILMVTHKEHLDEEEYLDYIRKLKASGNKLAIAVKIADLTNNSDYTRLGASRPEELSEKDRKRWEKYRKSLEILQNESNKEV